MHGHARIQQVPYPEDYRPDPKLRGKPKGTKQMLIKRGLRRERRADGSKYLLDCLIAGGCTTKMVIS
jgi:hypothetical protein